MDDVFRNEPEVMPGDKSKAEEVAKLLARMPEQVNDRVYYMLKGSEIFGNMMAHIAPKDSGIPVGLQGL